MGKVSKDKAEKVGEFLFRYMRARRRFNERVEHPLSPNELAALISSGKHEFDEIYIEPDANPPIVLDGKADDVFDAIVKKRYRGSRFGNLSFWPRGETMCSATVLCRRSQGRRQSARQLQGSDISD